MSKVYRPYEPQQVFLMPPSLQEWLSTDHLVYFLSDVIDHMNLSAITSRYEAEERGYPPYPPSDDGQGIVLCLLHWRSFLPKDREETRGGYSLPGAFG